jgi:hypothetical protein
MTDTAPVIAASSPSKEVRSETPALASPSTEEGPAASPATTTVSKTGRVRKAVDQYKEEVKEKAAFEIKIGRGVEMGECPTMSEAAARFEAKN